MSETERLMQPGINYDTFDTEHVDIVSAAVDNLTPRFREVIEGIYFERLSYAAMAKRLGFSSKAHVWRLTRRAVQQLRGELITDPIISERYRLKTWNDACAEVVYDLCDIQPLPLDLPAFDFYKQRMVTIVRDGAQPSSNMWKGLAREALGPLVLDHGYTDNKLIELLVRKQSDYGHENILAFGTIGVAVRVSDKIARLVNLSDRQTAACEPYEDTLADIVGYSTIALMLANDTFTLDLKAA